MTKTKADIKGPRTLEVSKAVYQLYQTMDLSAYPINPRILAGRLLKHGAGPNLLIATYSEFAAFRGSPLPHTISSCLKSQEGVTIYFQKENLHTILYNDQIPSEGRVNWTVAHELGHVLLNHYELINPVALKRAPHTDKKYQVLEKEADLFAKYFLCHPLVLYACGFDNPGDIMKTCKISGGAAKNRLYDIQHFSAIAENFNHYDKKILSLFSDFAYRRKCKTCGKIFSLGKACFCPVCGGKSLVFGSVPEARFQKEYDPFYYTLCPLCEQEISPGPRCQKCGGDIANHCMANGCHAALPADARYCPLCGGESQYSFHHQLTPWRP